MGGLPRLFEGWRNPAVAGGGGGGGGDVPSTRVISAGNGLTGGGDLSADRTLALANGYTLAGTTGNNFIKLPDNLAEAFWIGENTNRYLRFVTTNSAEGVYADKPFGMAVSVAVTAAGANQAAATLLTNQVSYVTGGNNAGVRLPAARPAGEIWEVICNTALTPAVGGGNAIIVYPATGETIVPVAVNVGMGLYAGNSFRILSLGSGSWRVIDVGHMLADASSEMYASTPVFYRGTQFYGGISMFSTLTMQSGAIDYTGATTSNQLRFPDNQAEAFWIGQSTNRYLSFVSTDGAEQVNVLKNMNVTGQVSQTIPSTLTTAGTTITVDWNNGNVEVIDLQGASGDVTLTLSNPKAGASYAVKVIQGSTPRNLVWPGTVKWAAGVVPVISVANDAIDLITMLWDGTNYLASFNQAYA